MTKLDKIMSEVCAICYLPCRYLCEGDDDCSTRQAIAAILDAPDVQARHQRGK